MISPRIAPLTGAALAWLALFGACTSAEPNASTVGSGGTAGTTAIDLGLGAAGARDEVDEAGDAGEGGQGEGRSVSECAAFASLDDCGVTSVEATFSAANVLLVIDKSSSMQDQPAGLELDKWSALKAALEPALRAVQEEMSFGLLLYPFSEKADIPLDCFEGCCEVPTSGAALQVGIEPGTSSVTKVMAALDASAPGGGTPTAAALDAALDYFTNGGGKSLKGDKFVLLATDGGPNCGGNDTVCDAARCTPNLDGLCPAEQGNCCEGEGEYCLDDAAVIEKLRALAAAGVPTFVIGIPGTERYADYLNAFAKAGGVTHPQSPPDYYAVSAEGGVAELARTFTDITSHLVRSCEVELAATVSDKRLVNVAVDCDFVSFEDGAGWDILPDAPKTLSILGEACDRVQREGARRIDVLYGCPTVK